MRVALTLTLLLIACADRTGEVQAAPDAAVPSAVAPTLHGTRPAEVTPLAPFQAVAQDGTARDRSALTGRPTAVWFYPAAGTLG